MRLAVFGANGPTGRHVTRLAVDEGHGVVACTRHPGAFDLADCLLRQAADDTYVHASIAVATPNAKPSMLKLIWREGIRKKS